jgi:hypothetical protein
MWGGAENLGHRIDVQTVMMIRQFFPTATFLSNCAICSSFILVLLAPTCISPQI